MTYNVFEKSLGKEYYNSKLKIAQRISLSDVFNFSINTDVHIETQESYRLKGYVYFDIEPKIVILIGNKTICKAICLELNSLAFEVILFEIINSVIILFNNSTFRHQREVCLELLQGVKDILIQFDGKDYKVAKDIYFSRYNALDDLSTVEDYMVFVYKELEYKTPDFLD